MALFVVYSAGLAALTLFPANLWSYVFDWLFRHKTWEIIWSDWSLLSFYPAWEETAANFAYLPQIFAPFEEICRAWRGWRWWRALLTGFSTSVSIELIQFFIGRSTDIDDVILNTAGTLFGFWMFWLLRAIFPNFTEKFHCQPKGGYYYG